MDNGFKKNEKYIAEIADIGVNGEGIGKINNFTVFVNNALPGERVEILLMKAKKNYGYGRLTKILRPSPDRTEAVCPAADKCGGCSIQHLSYPAQLKLKQGIVREDLRRIGGFEDAEVRPVIGMEEPFFYRNKEQYPIKADKNGRITIGYYARGSHRVIECEKCFTAHKGSEEITAAVRDFLEKYNIAPYNEQTHSGTARHILIRNGVKTGELMVCLVVNAKNFNYKKQFAEALKPFKNLKSAVINYNTEKTNVILGKRCETVYGSGEIREKIGDLCFAVSPLSFFQVNPIQTEKLYGAALDAAQLTGNETVIDAYCGAGTISLFLAQKAKHVCGIEIIPQAIENAKANAKTNGIENAEFFCGKSEDIVPELYEKRGLTPDVMVVDPPRKGCEKSLLELMLKMSPKRIVYVSCDSATLARDLKILCATGEYQIKNVQPVDMFPHSVHIETVCLLTRKSSGI